MRSVSAPSSCAARTTCRALRRRLEEFTKRTLRRQVLEYVQYTERKPVTIPFQPGPDEQRLYDLPWNPRRVEQRICRCHRYGQQFDVVVINFLNQRNEVDRRVLELLSEKFHLVHGVFGASDDILGRIESGVDFEKRIAAIYDTCRTPEAIAAAFAKLQAELGDDIEARMQETECKLLENFDARIHELLKIRHQRAVESLDRITRLFWQLTRFILSAKQNLLDTKTRIQDAKRRARLAESVEEQRTLQEDLKTLERQQRRQRQSLFDVEDEIEAHRDQLIEALEKRMKKKTLVHPLFRIRWQIV
jgi:hypothetical protein